MTSEPALRKQTDKLVDALVQTYAALDNSRGGHLTESPKEDVSWRFHVNVFGKTSQIFKTSKLRCLN